MFDLRPYQKPIAEKVFTYMRNNPANHCLVALPTGAGKTVVLSDLIKKAIKKWPKTHVLVISHVKEILEQDHKSIEFHTAMDVGIYSAGIGKREKKQVTVASIQSVFRRAKEFAKYKFIIIDECHLIPPSDKSMYRKFLLAMKGARYFGLTATPFRLGAGYIYGQEDSLFNDLVYDMTSKEKFSGLIKDGFLCNLKTSATDIELETDGVKTVAGDFDQKMLSTKIDKDSITKLAIKEIIQKGANYKKWLIFAIDIEHAENIAEELTQNGIPTMVVHSKMEFDRDTVIRHYKLGTFRAIVNVNVLTTGFDDPEIDLIALLRPTKSPVIHVQTIGRGLRIAPNKDHCLILDFAGNTERLGPINDIVPYVKKKTKGGGEPITKRCPACDTIHHPTKKICDFCGHVFQFKTLLQANAKQVDVIRDKTQVWLKVHDVEYQLYKKTNSPSMVKVTYHCGLRHYHEYVCVEHKGWAGYKAEHWMKFRGVEGCRTALALVHRSDELAVPNRVHIDKTEKYPRIKDYSF